MKKVLPVILLVCLLLCACSPFEEKVSDPVATQTFRVYVCGAVAEEGFVEVAEGTDLAAVLLRCGTVKQTVYPQNPLQIVTSQTKQLVLDYCENGKTFSCVNLNGYLVASASPIENVPQHVMDALAQYVSQHKITNKKQLLQILGEEDYLQNHYKFFVSVDDYEEDC